MGSFTLDLIAGFIYADRGILSRSPQVFIEQLQLRKYSLSTSANPHTGSRHNPSNTLNSL